MFPIQNDHRALQPIADRVAQHLEIISKKTFNSLLGAPGFLWDLSVSCDYLVPIVNPMGSTLVRLKDFRNNLKILCHPMQSAE